MKLRSFVLMASIALAAGCGPSHHSSVSAGVSTNATLSGGGSAGVNVSAR